jgi:hypothetical protein
MVVPHCCWVHILIAKILAKAAADPTINILPFAEQPRALLPTCVTIAQVV